MLRLIAFGIACGAAVQGWRNFPSDGPLSPNTAMLVSTFGVVCAFLGGLWFGRGGARASATAVASAEATAVASNQVNVLVMNAPADSAGEQGAGAPVYSTRIPTDSAPWLAGQRAQVTADDLDGMDLADLGLPVAQESPD